MGCDTYQRTKAHCEKKHTSLNPNKILSALWEIILVDFIEELPISQGFNIICVIINCFSKQIYTIPTNTELTLEGIAKIY